MGVLGSKLAIVLQEPLRSTAPFIPSCVTREKYFTARCAKPLQGRVPLQPISQATVCEPLFYGSVAQLARTRCGTIAAHLTAVYHSCAGYSIVKILCPSTYKELAEAFCSPVLINFVTMQKPRHMAAVFFALYLYGNGRGVLQPYFTQLSL